MLRTASLGPLLAVASCLPPYQTTSDYCERDSDCNVPGHPERSFCDVNGEYQEWAHLCIEPPWDGGVPDPDAAIDAGAECTSSSQCTAPNAPICGAGGTCEPCAEGETGDDDCAAKNPLFPRCKATGACVECLGPGDCTAASEPVCDAASDACRECQAHAECASEVCDLGSGACVDAATIVYVDQASGADGGSCGSQGSPCATLGGAQGGLAKVDSTKTLVRVRDGVYGESVAVTDGKSVTLVGAGATVSPPSSSNTPGLLVTGGSEVTLDGLSLANATGGSNADGVRCSGSSSSVTLIGVAISGNAASGVQATDCTVVVTGATISGNDATGVQATSCTLTIARTTISGNDGGGVSIDSCAFTLVNSFIVRNGATGAGGTSFGGVRVWNSADRSPQLFEFNTVADNAASSIADSSGVECAVVSAMVASSNIVYANNGAPALDTNANCAWAYSDIQGGQPGTENLDTNPEFEDPAGGDFHLQTGSPCQNVADPDATLDVDFDGQPRPMGGRRDVGADEVVE